MSNRIPILPGAGQTNVYGEDTYKLRVAVGAAGAITFRSLAATIVRNSAGNYTVTLPCTYEEITSFVLGYLLCAAGQVLFGVILTSTVGTDGTFVFEIRTAAGTATNPASGDKFGIIIGVSSNILNTKFTG